MLRGAVLALLTTLLLQRASTDLVLAVVHGGLGLNVALLPPVRVLWDELFCAIAVVAWHKCHVATWRFIPEQQTCGVSACTEKSHLAADLRESTSMVAQASH